MLYTETIGMGLDVNATVARISKLINESGLDDKQLGERLGVSVQAINKWRNGHNLPEAENLLILSRILGKKVDDFLVPSEVIQPTIEFEDNLVQALALILLYLKENANVAPAEAPQPMFEIEIETEEEPSLIQRRLAENAFHSLVSILNRYIWRERRKDRVLMNTDKSGDIAAIDMEATGSRIKGLMDKRNVSIREVGDYMDISPQAVHRWLKGETLPTIEKMYNLGQVLDTNVDDVLVAKQ